MILLIILLFLSGVLNVILIFVLVRKYDEQKLNLGLIEGSNVGGVEYFDLHRSNSSI
jgi:hypothetical protein